MAASRSYSGSITALSWVNLGSIATLPLVSDGAVATGCFSDSKNNAIDVFINNNRYHSMVTFKVMFYGDMEIVTIL